MWRAWLVAVGRRRDELSAAVVAVALTLTACAHATRDLDPVLVRRLDAAIDKAMGVASIPGAIVGVWWPQGRYVRAVGVSDQATGAPMAADFYTRIGSETKTFTVTAVLQLADQGRVHLDDSIARYVDGVPNGDRITLRQLARMQSGLPNYCTSQQFLHAYLADPHRHFSPQELLDYAFRRPPVSSPGVGFHYSNTNAVLLGLVVEKVSGRALPDYIRDYITTPLGLQHTSFPTTNAFPEPHAQGYTDLSPNGAKTIATDWDPSWAWAAGAMISTLDDLHIWAAAVATGELLTAGLQRQRLETVAEPGAPVRIGYGLGITDFAGWVGHSGNLPGYETVAAYLPEQRITMVILTNTNIKHDDNDPGMTLAAAVTNLISPGHRYALTP